MERNRNPSTGVGVDPPPPRPPEKTDNRFLSTFSIFTFSIFSRSESRVHFSLRDFAKQSSPVSFRRIDKRFSVNLMMETVPGFKGKRRGKYVRHHE